MIDIVLETIRLAILLFLVLHLVRARRPRSEICEKGFCFIVIGFSLLLFANVLDITDNVEYLSRFVIVGDTPVQAFLEKMVGYLGGMVFLTIGLVKWLPELSARDLLEVSERRFSDAFETSGIGMAFVGLDGRWVKVNRSLCGILGYNEEELLSRTIADVTYEEDVDKSVKHLQKLVSGEIRSYTIDKRYVHKDGYIVYVLASVCLVRDTAGEPLYVVAQIDDVTDRKLAEEEVKREAAKLSAMISSMKEGVVFADASDNIIEVNPYFTELVSRPREEIMGGSLWDIHEGVVADKLKLILDGFKDNPASKEFVLQRPLGDLVVNLRMQPIYSDNEYSGVLLNVIDVTSLVRARRELEDTNRRLIEATDKANDLAAEAKAANLLKSQFLANMSHDIRTPMNGIIGFSEMLGSDEITETQREYVNHIRSCGENLLRLIDDILDLSKIEAGKIHVEMVDCTLNDIVDSIEPMMKSKASNKGIEFKVVRADCLPQQICTDPARVNQCLVNLTNNAVKFTEKGHVSLNVSLEDAGDESFIRFDVDDTGIGIAPERQADIFEAFVQAERSTTREFGGTGLGLAITRSLAELLGGRLTVTSELGKGSVFSLAIPLIRSVSVEPEVGEGQSPQAADVGGNAANAGFSGKVLVAEDDKVNQLLITKLLEKMGFEVVIAEDGAAAVQKCLEDSFSLILMDMQMPNMNGYEATAKLRDMGVCSPIVALTANAMAGDERKCREAGCDDYVTKPVVLDILREVLARHIPTSRGVVV